MNTIDWNGLDEAARVALLQRPVQAVADRVRSGVAAIFEAVAARGDARGQLGLYRQLRGIRFGACVLSIRAAPAGATGRARSHRSGRPAGAAG